VLVNNQKSASEGSDYIL